MKRSGKRAGIRRQGGQSLIEYTLSWAVVGTFLFAAQSSAGFALARVIHDFYRSVCVVLH